MLVRRFFRRLILLAFLIMFMYSTFVFVTGGRAKEKLVVPIVPSLFTKQIYGILRSPTPSGAGNHTKPVNERRMQDSNITVDDVVITVKTTVKHHYTRLPLILETWVEQARNQVWYNDT